MFKNVAPMLIVGDLEKAVRWYADVLGARLQHTSPAHPPYEWVSLRLGSLELMFAAPEPARKWYTNSVIVSDSPSNLILYFFVSDAVGLHQKIKRKADVVMEPVDQPYGIKEFAIKDPFGCVLVFAQEVSG